MVHIHVRVHFYVAASACRCLPLPDLRAWLKRVLRIHTATSVVRDGNNGSGKSNCGNSNCDSSNPDSNNCGGDCERQQSQDQHA